MITLGLEGIYSDGEKMEYTIPILMTEFVTHDVKRFITDKPSGFSYQPGQGIELFINQPEWLQEEGRAFTPTSLPDDKILEFTIKRYKARNRVTNKLHTLHVGDELLISKPFGTINYKGPGIFIAGGAGITPFLAILRQLAEENRLAGHALLFSNKTPADIICEKELRHYLGDECILTCTQESVAGYYNRRLDSEFIQEKIATFSQFFYVCGPDKFVENINDILLELGVRSESLVFEQQ